MSKKNEGHHVRIVTPEFASMGTRVFIDDMEIAQIINVEFNHRVENPPIVLIEFCPESVEIGAEALVVMTERTG